MGRESSLGVNNLYYKYKYNLYYKYKYNLYYKGGLENVKCSNLGFA